MAFPFPITPQSDDERFMLEALKEAWKAFQKDRGSDRRCAGS